MNNNGYVWVKFSENSKEYVYAVPLNIDPESIQRYVLVENMFYNPRENISPYTVAKVVKYNRNDCGDKATKYIVDIIDGDTYKENRQRLAEQQLLENRVRDICDEIWEQLPVEKLAVAMIEYCEDQELYNRLTSATLDYFEWMKKND